jgi:Cu+-exporting ATPase
MAALRLKVQGMHCDHCKVKVERALQQLPGVYGASVDLEGGAAEVDFDPAAARPEALVAAVKAAGYQAEVSS